MWDIKEQATNEQVIQINKNQSHRYRKQNGGYQSGKALGREQRAKVVKHIVMERD